MLENGMIVMVLEHREFRYGTWIHRKRVDGYILGCMDSTPAEEYIDRTIVQLPCRDNLVLVYNKHLEALQRELNEKGLRDYNYVAKPHAVIPELSMEVYSRSIVCRRDADGQLESLHGEDFEICEEYFKKALNDHA